MHNIGVIIGITLMYAAPLIYTALGGVISENGGVINIGLEGMMTLGAFIGAAVGFYVGNPWIAFLAGGLGGAFLALFHGIACIHFSADHVISGIALNFIGPGLSIFLSRLLFDGAAMTKPIPTDNKIPKSLGSFLTRGSFIERAFNQYDTVYIAFILVFVVWFVLYKTKLGLRIRSVGEHPNAADSLGVNVYRIKYISVLLSGFLAGLGGASMSLAVVSNFRPTLISGQGFIAMAAMIFGKWRPQGAMWACILFGAAQGIGVTLGVLGVNISSSILSMGPYIITLIALIIIGGEGSGGPSANGEPFEKN